MINESLLSGEQAGYASAAIGAEVLVRRLESWRIELARWIENNIYRQIARMKALGGDRRFIDEEATKELEKDIEEPVYKYPKIKWNELNIRDQTQKGQLYIQLFDKQLISAQTLCEYFNFDYDTEVERIRFETAAQQFSAGGAAAGAAGGAGGMDMGLGGMGGGGGGGAPMPEAPGGAGGMDMGVGGDAAGGGGGVTPPPAGGEAGGAPAMGGSVGKILTKGRASKHSPPKEEAVQPQMIRMTSLEQAMYKTLLNMQIPFKKWIQFPLGKYKTDFAIPAIRLAVECDGEYWHRQPQAKAHDQKRDAEIARFGWTVVRYKEIDIKGNMDGIRNDLQSLVNKCWKRALSQQKQAFSGLQKGAQLQVKDPSNWNLNQFLRVNGQSFIEEEYDGIDLDKVVEDSMEIVSDKDRSKEKYGDLGNGDTD
jgi:very-short-patch-repair endonuclease